MSACAQRVHFSFPLWFICHALSLESSYFQTSLILASSWLVSVLDHVAVVVSGALSGLFFASNSPAPHGLALAWALGPLSDVTLCWIRRSCLALLPTRSKHSCKGQLLALSAIKARGMIDHFQSKHVFLFLWYGVMFSELLVSINFSKAGCAGASALGRSSAGTVGSPLASSFIAHHPADS